MTSRAEHYGHGATEMAIAMRSLSKTNSTCMAATAAGHYCCLMVIGKAGSRGVYEATDSLKWLDNDRKQYHAR